MRRLVYSVAASADGFIARSDGAIDWLEDRAAADYGMEEFVRGVDTVVWGRRTFDESLPRGGVEPFGPRLKHVVVTHRPPPAKTDPRVAFHRGPLPDLVRRLRSEPGKDVWVMGGASLAGALLDAGGVDEVVVHQIPVLLGAGIPLFAPAGRTVPLELVETRAFPDGVVRLHHRVRTR
jgi:dihydrofolate reductase